MYLIRKAWLITVALSVNMSVAYAEIESKKLIEPGISYCKQSDGSLVQCHRVNFAHIPNGDGTFDLCRTFSNGRCDGMPGTLEIRDEKGLAEFKHVLGPAVNGQLTEHLWQFFTQESSMRCEQQSACIDSANCEVKMLCE